jgi:hypothetical protein
MTGPELLELVRRGKACGALTGEEAHALSVYVLELEDTYMGLLTGEIGNFDRLETLEMIANDAAAKLP